MNLGINLSIDNNIMVTSVVSPLVPEGKMGVVLIYGQSESLGSKATTSINTSGNPSNAKMLTEGVRVHYNDESSNVNRLMDTTNNTTNIALAEVDGTPLDAAYGETPASGAASIICPETSEDVGFCSMGRSSGTYELIGLNTQHFANAIQALTLFGKNASKDVYVLGVVLPWGAAESAISTTESTFKGYLREMRTDFQRYINAAFGTTHEIKFIIPQFSALNYSGVPENIALAQLNESFENTNIHLLPVHGIGFKEDYADGVHWSAEMTEAIGQASAQLLLDNESGIRPLSITDSGSQIVITVDGTKGSLTTDVGVTGTTDNGIRIDAGTISSVVLGTDTITVNYSGGTPTTVSLAWDTSATVPEDCKSDIWDGTNHCAMFELSTTWSRPSETADPTLPTYTHTIDSSFTKITGHTNYMGMFCADDDTHTATTVKDYGKSGYDFTLSNGTFPTVETINSRDSLKFGGSTNFLSTKRAMPIGDFSIIYVGRHSSGSVSRTPFCVYPSASNPQWRLWIYSNLIKWSSSSDAFAWQSITADQLYLLVVSYDCKTQTYSYSIDGGTVSTSVSPASYFLNGNQYSQVSIGGREIASGSTDDYLGESSANDYISTLAFIASDIHNDGTGAGIITDLKTYYSIT